jgi:hypothetical protein
MGKVWRCAWPVLILGLLCAIFFWDVLWLPSSRIVAGNDLANMFHHWLDFAVGSIWEGRLPLWNPYLSSGLPFVSNPQPALFYPPTWLALLVPVPRALGLIVVLHLWLAGVGMIAWLRSEGASAVGALFGGIVFAFSGYFFVRVQAGHLGVITTGTWLPFVLWACRRAVTRGSWGLAVLGGLPVGLSILAGHTASFLYVALGLAAYAVFCAWECWREERSARAAALPLLQSSVILVVGLALAAVQVLPMVELVMQSIRQGSGYDFAARFSWPPGHLLTLLVPNFFGEPLHTGYWGDGIYDEFILYVGVLPLLLALLGLRLRQRLKPFLFALGLGALLLAFGEYGALHRLFYRFVPLFQSARAPARAGFLFTLAAAALAGLAVTALTSASPPLSPPMGGIKGGDERRRLLALLKRPLILTVAGIAAAVVVAGFLAFAWGRESNPEAGRLYHVANRVAIFLFFFLLSAGLLGAWRKGSLSRRAFWLLAVGLVLLDLWAFGGEAVQPVDVPESTYWRIVAQAVDDPQAARVLPWGLSDFEQNGGMPFGLRSVFGYDPLVLERYEEFITSLPDPRARTYDLLNAGYLVTTAPQDFADDPDAPRLVLEESGVWVYERPGALPRAWVVPQVEVLGDEAMLARIHEPDFHPRAVALVESPLACAGDGTGAVESVRDEGNRVEARVQGGGGLLVFSEVHYPGWRAEVDGEPAPLVRADYVLRAVCVPAGEHRVVLVYDPPLLKIGLAITGMALLLVFGVAVWQFRCGRDFRITRTRNGVRACQDGGGDPA